MQETQVQSLSQEDPLEKEMAIIGNPMDRGARWATVHGVAGVGHNLATKPPSPTPLLASNNTGISWVSHNNK